MTTMLDPAMAAAAQTHHEALRSRLVRLTRVLLSAVDQDIPHEPSRRRLAAFLRGELLPHLDAEDGLLFHTVQDGPVALLARAMHDEHRALTALVQEVERATAPMDAVVAASALVVLFDVRVRHETQHLLPALADAGVDMAALLEEAPEIIGMDADRSS